MPATLPPYITILGLLVVAAPIMLLAALGIPSLTNRRLAETVVGWLAPALISLGLLAALIVLGWMLVTDVRRLPIVVGHWVVIPNYHFAIKFEFDRLSVPLVILSFVLCGTIGAFANRYMHREPGYNRFFVLYAMFLLGMVVTSLAGTIETLFAGWEMVGLSSALLVAFFHERPGPVRNGLRVWSVYRIADAALLLASVALHHMLGEGDFDTMMGMTKAWPEGVVQFTQSQALLVGGLLLVAAAGKSALVPFSGWLPRAMEGPTPSSAVFYGALSVHLGAYLLLRISPIIEASWILRLLVLGAGVSTAVFATMSARAQSDIKSALSFASMAQVGIIVVWIGLGFDYLALIHIIGHGCLRTLQFVRAPTLLYDYKTMEDAIGQRLPRFSTAGERLASSPMRTWLYRWALERGYLDALLTDYLVNPFLAVFAWCDRAERRWTEFLAGTRAKEPEVEPDSARTFDDLL